MKRTSENYLYYGGGTTDDFLWAAAAIRICGPDFGYSWVNTRWDAPPTSFAYDFALAYRKRWGPAATPDE